MTDEPAGGAVADERDLLARLHAMEREAAERYAELADQMETHNNRAVAAVFRELAAIEGRHATRLEAHAGALPPVLPRGTGEPPGFERPETTPLDLVHYLMTPDQALALALANEERAARRFEAVAASAPEGALRRLAAELAAEEWRHAQLIRERLGRCPPRPPDWDHDPDPPRFSE
jgi:rubrerythrin